MNCAEARGASRKTPANAIQAQTALINLNAFIRIKFQDVALQLTIMRLPSVKYKDQFPRTLRFNPLLSRILLIF